MTRGSNRASRRGQLVTEIVADPAWRSCWRWASARSAVSAGLLNAFGLASGGGHRAHGNRLSELCRACLQLSSSCGRRIIDRRDVPFFRASAAAGRWMLLSQASVSFGLIGIAFGDPVAFAGLDRGLRVLRRLFVGDAGRGGGWLAHRRCAVERQGMMSASYQLGYRIALLCAGAGALYIADFAWLEGGLYHDGRTHGRRHRGKPARAASAANGAERPARILPQALCRAGRRSHSAQGG